MNLIEKLKIRTATIIIYVASIMMGMGSLGSCVDDINIGNGFLDKQPGVDVTVDSIFVKERMQSVSSGTCTVPCTILSPIQVQYGILTPML